MSTDLEHHGASYRPAMDGYRGLFVLLVMAYHFGATFLVGGWVGINHFFVFSGFLIGTILIKEIQRTGQINAIRFYLRRARRIIPAMTVLVVAVLIHLFTQTSENRQQTAGDAGATMTFWLNWRLIARNDQYFDTFEAPSPLRHVWTLAVEEQFYVAIPLLIFLVYRLLRGRTWRFTVVFGLAIASAVWTWHLSFSATSSRLYYSTDVRMQALLVGVAGAVLWTKAEDGTRIAFPRTVANLLGWVGTVGSIGAFFVLSQDNIGMFRYGGMTAFAVVAALMGITALDTRDLSINRIVSTPVLVHLGQISYALYLFHWPVGLWFTFDGLHRLVAGLLQLAITWVLAVLSYRLVELPIMLHGVRGLIPVVGIRSVAGPAAIATITTVSLAAALVLPTSDEDRGNGQPLVAGVSYQRPARPVKVAVVGDSVPASLMEGFDPKLYPGLEITNQASLGGCNATPIIVSLKGKLSPEGPHCPSWREQWPREVRKAGSEIVVSPAGLGFLLPIHVNGRDEVPGSPVWRRELTASLDALLVQTKAAGARRLQVVNVPCRVIFLSKYPRDFRELLGDDPVVLKSDAANQLIAEWAQQHAAEGVSVVDLDKPLCSNGFRSHINGVRLYKDDGIHFTKAAGALVWTWLGEQIVALVG